jgi:hypothetical protein
MQHHLYNLKQEAQLQAIRRYIDRIDDIDKIRKDLEMVRQGLIPLIQLDTNSERIQSRIEREHAPLKVAVERINGTNDFQEAAIIDRLALLKQTVCRISLGGQGVGTGFLVAEGVILTNHHVIPDTNTAMQLQAEFDYELDLEKKLKPSQICKFRPDLLFYTSSITPQPNDPLSGLDFTFIAIETPVDFDKQYPIAQLDGTYGKVVLGEQCITIQHPSGEPKKVVFKNISLLKFTDKHIIYESDTLPGSSGSMVIGLGTGEIIALHHAGVPRRDAYGNALTKTGSIAYAGTPDEQIDWEGNEGVRISCIIDAFEKATLPDHMRDRRNMVLEKTIAQRSGFPINENTSPTSQHIKPITIMPTAIPATASAGNRTVSSVPVSFIILIINDTVNISMVNAFLSNKYGTAIIIELIMPLTANEGESELFGFSAPVAGNTGDEIAGLLRFPHILAAEADEPMPFNTHDDVKTRGNGLDGTPAFESAIKEKIWEDEFSIWNEDDFKRLWEDKSAYVKGQQLENIRKWNHFATGFHKVEESDYALLEKANISIAQLDTGFTNHSKVSDGFDQDKDYDAVDNDDDAEDKLTRGVMKQPGHGTRTGSILIGVEPPNSLPPESHDGNLGLLRKSNIKIIPYRIAKTVILLDRQQELAKAVDRAISGGVQVMTMSMGTAPTITTARLAKKAYDAGVIWCCAAGNEVKFVVGPAVFPGTIAVAASNPLDAPWSKSSEGNTVDITAPGEDVYVPIFTKDTQGRVGEDFAYGDGTSYATPHVAAAAALWLAKYRSALQGIEGWRRVEAFRKAIRVTARTKHRLRKGYGAGILDVEALLNSDKANPNKELKIAELSYAYNNWNEHAFLASLQGWTELFKTYWKIAHRGMRRLLGWESVLFTDSGAPLSDFARGQEAFLFGQRSGLESTASVTPEEAVRRLQILNQLILENAQPANPQ